MADHIDAVNPANIPATWDGLPAARITVFADPAGQCFDVSDTGNAPASKVAQAVAGRYQANKWSVCYINESGEAPMTAALELVGLGWTDARYWPRRGVYMWAADPSGNITAGRWHPPVTPVLVQDRYPGPYDLSTIAASSSYPGRVAGYIDGPNSVWPASAWARFSPIPDIPLPGGLTMADTFEMSIDGKVIVAKAKDQPNHLLCFISDDHRNWDVIDIVDGVNTKAHAGGDPRDYSVD